MFATSCACDIAAGKGARQNVSMVIVPPPVWALGYVLFALGISHLANWLPVPGLPAVPVAVFLIGLGIVMSVSAAMLFRREGTELNPASTTNRKLVTSGPFRLTRNPMYLGLVLITLGIAFWIGAWPMFLAPVATFATANWAHIPFEEAKMHRQFGADFEAYTLKVRRWV
jgi:protein-S-isoprenylcysteine O-methyltransferase Ste14